MTSTIVPSDQARLRRSKEHALHWQMRAQDFRRLPTLIRWLLGGAFTQTSLDTIADQTLEDYLNEAIQWH